MDQLSIQYSHPRWILESYLKQLGDIIRVEEECIANNKNPKVCVIAWPNQATQAELLGNNENFSPAPWVDSGVEITGDPAEIPAIKELRASVQDQGSFLVSKAFVDIPLESDEFWLDLCAGPGGKSALLDRWASQRGIDFIANEISVHRAKLMQRSTNKILISDGLIPAFRAESFTRVLVDAPCSGLGALRRRPDARWRKKESEIQELIDIQSGLLDNAGDLVKIGGILGYVLGSAPGLFGIFIAYALFVLAPAVKENIRKALWIGEKLSSGKFFVDEVLGVLVVAPLRGLSGVCSRVLDQSVSIGTGNAVGSISRAVGELTCRVTTGQVSTYVLWMFGSAALLLYVFLPVR